MHEISAKVNESITEKCSLRTVQRNLHALGYKRRSVWKRINIKGSLQKAPCLLV